ncbi:DeoR family transcriptional regulator [Neobacillus niacini]|uniref:DeoR family transcriptional regulator n=1 Tax=Neobacillus niacini TaxID=86668 RepID=UPI0005EEA5CD|nr:DeoR family transcriptional regulator [Neobacillus niacini]
MLANERQQQIKELINQRKNLKVSELSEIFHVSDMTIHRDIKPLVEEGIVEKTFGGISLIEKATRQVNNNECVVCSRRIQDRLSYRLILTNNRVESACCTHCGMIRHKLLEKEVMEALSCDFFTHTTISARNAWFVIDSTIDLSCCQPQAIPFNQREHAEGFVRGFGGKLFSFSEAMDKMTGQISQTKACCQHD